MYYLIISKIVYIFVLSLFQIMTKVPLKRQQPSFSNPTAITYHHLPPPTQHRIPHLLLPTCIRVRRNAKTNKKRFSNARTKRYAPKRKSDATLRVLSIRYPLPRRICLTSSWTGLKSIMPLWNARFGRGSTKRLSSILANRNQH